MNKQMIVFVNLLLITFISGYGQNIFYSEPIHLKEIVGRDFNEIKLEGFFFYKKSNGKFPSFTHRRIIKKITPNSYLVMDNGFNSIVFDTVFYSYDNCGNLLTYKDFSTIVVNKYSFVTDSSKISTVRTLKIRNYKSILNTPDTIDILTKYFYNKAGNLECEIQYNVTDSINYIQKTNYHYNIQNNLIKKVEFDESSNDSIVTLYLYKDSLLIKEELFYFNNPKSIIKYIYDKKNRLIRVKGMNPLEIKYDLDGRVIYHSAGFVGFKPLRYLYANDILFRLSTGKGNSKMYYLIDYK